MTDIATLDLLDGLADIRNALHSGRFGQREVWEKHLEDASAALSRFTAPPPEKIAGLIERLHGREPLFREPPKESRIIPVDTLEAIECALRSLALENERLHGQLDTVSESHNPIALEATRMKQRITELEAERDALKEDRDAMVEAAKDAFAECDAIRAKTFEECAQMAFVAGCGMPGCTQCIGGGLAAAIRALAQSEKDEEAAAPEPLPEEIAELIAETDRALREAPQDILRRNRDALRSQALENERLEEESATRLRHLESAVEKVGRANERITELEAAAKAPLPEEIAGLIERANTVAGEQRKFIQWYPSDGASAALNVLIDMIDALRSQALKIERLHERLEDNHEFQLIDGKMTRVEVKPGSIPDGIECRDATINLKRERIRELEAECVMLRTYKDTILREEIPSPAQRAAIRNETIEECAHLCEPIDNEHFPPSWSVADVKRHIATRNWCAAAIRALAQSEKDEENSHK